MKMATRVFKFYVYHLDGFKTCFQNDTKHMLPLHLPTHYTLLKLTLDVLPVRRLIKSSPSEEYKHRTYNVYCIYRKEYDFFKQKP